MSKHLATWQRLAIDRAVVAELAAMEADEARIIGDDDRITIADRYFREAQQMLTAARVKLRQLELVAA